MQQCSPGTDDLGNLFRARAKNLEFALARFRLTWLAFASRFREINDSFARQRQKVIIYVQQQYHGGRKDPVSLLPSIISTEANTIPENC
jgi:hypothetical protein